MVNFPFQEGKEKHLKILEKDPTGSFLQLVRNMGNVDNGVCVDEACYKKLIQMSGKVDKLCYLSVAAKSNPAPFKLGINCVAFTGFNLSPWSSSERVIVDSIINLEMHIQ